MTTPLASILPQPETQFCDANGVPYAGGKVYTYIPSTSTPKNTWQDAGATVLNTNPITLDSAGRCLMYGEGQYRILLKDSLGNTIYDQLSQDLLGVLGTVAYENIGPNLKDDGAGNLVSKITTAGTLTAATTTDLGSITTDVITISGNTTITGFGSSANTANPFYILTFSGTPLLTYNATSLILPSAANIQASAGDTAFAQYLGSGNWRILSYNLASGFPVKSSFNINIQTITTTGTYTPTAKTQFGYTQIVGAGGGGGGVGPSGNPTAQIGAGGGGGGFAFGILTAAQIGASQTVTIGAGGTAGASGGGNGGTGGTTTFGALLTANGGTGGGHTSGTGANANGAVNGGIGGTASGTTGIIGLKGNTGGAGFLALDGGGNGSVLGGAGANSAFGAGGAALGLGSGNSVAGNTGDGYGSGGGGAVSAGVASSNAGGSGTPGICIIIEYIGT